MKTAQDAIRSATDARQLMRTSEATLKLLEELDRMVESACLQGHDALERKHCLSEDINGTLIYKTLQSKGYYGIKLYIEPEEPYYEYDRFPRLHDSRVLTICFRW